MDTGRGAPVFDGADTETVERCVFERVGPAVSKEIVKDETAAYFEGERARTVEECVFKRVGRLLP